MTVALPTSKQPSLLTGFKTHHKKGEVNDNVNHHLYHFDYRADCFHPCLSEDRWGEGIEENGQFPLIEHGIPQGPDRGKREGTGRKADVGHGIADAIDRVEKSLRTKPERKPTRKKPPGEKSAEEEAAVSKTPDETRE
jgi:hypothetical protein